MTYVRIDAADGTNLVPEQTMPIVPPPLSLVQWQETYRITDAPPTLQYRELPGGKLPRWCVCLRGERLK